MEVGCALSDFIKLISIAAESGWTDWDRVTLRKLAPVVDFHSIHCAYFGIFFSGDFYGDASVYHEPRESFCQCYGPYVFSLFWPF